MFVHNYAGLGRISESYFSPASWNESEKSFLIIPASSVKIKRKLAFYQPPLHSLYR